MSRSMLYATLGVLLVILFGTSYALRKQTDPPKPPEPTAEQQAAKQQEMVEKQKGQMEIEKQKRLEMANKAKAQQKAEKANLAAAAKAHPAAKINPKKTSGVDISDKWFNETPDGPAGIQQAIKEKEAIDKYNAEKLKQPVVKNAPELKLNQTAPTK